MADNWKNAFALGPCKVSVYQDPPDGPEDAPLAAGIMSAGDSMPFVLDGVDGVVRVDVDGVVTLERDEPMVTCQVHVQPTYDVAGRGRVTHVEARDLMSPEGWAYPVTMAVFAAHLMKAIPASDEILYTDLDTVPPPDGPLPPPEVIDFGELVDGRDGMSILIYRDAPH